MYYIYNFLFFLAVPFILVRLWWRQRKLPDYEQRVLERFGIYNHKPLDESIWFHAVSYGETVAAEPLVKALHQKYPHIPIVITNMTTSGAKRTKERFPDIATQYFVPYDLPFAVKRFLKQTKPKILIILETEFWPNILKYTKKYNIPTLLANGRLSKKSLRGYHRILRLANRMVQQMTKIAAQASTDCKRYCALGADKENITITGNMKFDIKAPQDQIDAAKTWRNQINNRPIWIAASTHPGEETQLLEIHQQLKQQAPNLLLVLVPRHPQRFDEVFQLCQQYGTTVRRSSHQTVDQQTDIFLGDTMGELFFYYAIADVAFMGGSLAPIGGHNFLECVAVNTPIIIGPDYHNFTAMVKMFRKGGGIQVTKDQADTKNILEELLSDENKREQQANNAYAIWSKNSGSVERHVEMVSELLDT